MAVETVRTVDSTLINRNEQLRLHELSKQALTIGIRSPMDIEPENPFLWAAYDFAWISNDMTQAMLMEGLVGAQKVTIDKWKEIVGSKVVPAELDKSNNRIVRFNCYLVMYRKVHKEAYMAKCELDALTSVDANINEFIKLVQGKEREGDMYIPDGNMLEKRKLKESSYEMMEEAKRKRVARDLQQYEFAVMAKRRDEMSEAEKYAQEASDNLRRELELTKSSPVEDIGGGNAYIANPHPPSIEDATNKRMEAIAKAKERTEAIQRQTGVPINEEGKVE